MSADRWSVCPKCGQTREQIKAERQRALDEAYGTVPRVEWEAMVAEAEKPSEVLETFREDWDIGVDDDVPVRVAYKGRCQRCGARSEFKHEHPIEGGRKDG